MFFFVFSGSEMSHFSLCPDQGGGGWGSMLVIIRKRPGLKPKVKTKDEEEHISGSGSCKLPGAGGEKRLANGY